MVSIKSLHVLIFFIGREKTKRKVRKNERNGEEICGKMILLCLYNKHIELFLFPSLLLIINHSIAFSIMTVCFLIF